MRRFPPPPIYIFLVDVREKLIFISDCCIIIISRAQCYTCNFRTAEVSGCDKLTVVLFFQAAATVKIWTNSEHFENSDQYKPSSAHILKPIETTQFVFGDCPSILALIFEPFELDHSLRALYIRHFKTLRMHVIQMSYLRLISRHTAPLWEFWICRTS